MTTPRLAALLLLTLVGCGSKQNNDPQSAELERARTLDGYVEGWHFSGVEMSPLPRRLVVDERQISVAVPAGEARDAIVKGSCAPTAHPSPGMNVQSCLFRGERCYGTLSSQWGDPMPAVSPTTTSEIRAAAFNTTDDSYCARFSGTFTRPGVTGGAQTAH